MNTATTEQVTIGKLPKEVLLSILEYLQNEDLLQSALVCKTWNEIISSNFATMKKLSLHWSNYAEPTRKYAKIFFCGTWEEPLEELLADKQFLKVTEMKSHVRELVYQGPDYSGCFLKIGLMEAMVKTLLNVEKVTFRTFSPLRNYRESVKYEKLKRFVLQDLQPTHLPFLNAPNLTSIKISCSHLNNAENNYLKDFPKLQELALYHSSITGLVLLKRIEEVSCSLKKLSLRDSMSNTDSLTLAAFFKKFSNTLEELELQDSHFHPIQVLANISLPKLKVLKINFTNTPEETEFYENFKSFQNVKTLILIAPVENLIAVQGLIGNSPKIETLRLDFHVTNNLMIFITNNLPALRVLQVSSVNGDGFQDVTKLLTLKELHVYTIHNGDMTFDGWKQMIESCPNIETLSIDDFGDFVMSDEVVQSIAGIKKLQNLYIGKVIVTNEDFLALLSNSCESLKCVKILKTSVEHFMPLSNDFILVKPQLTVLEREPDNHCVDFNLWANEELIIDESDSEEFNSEFSDYDLDVDIDDGNDYDGSDDENGSDEEFDGAFRPG